MIKQYWEITLRDYDIIERTGRVSHLRKWYNPLPTGWFIKRIKKERNQLLKQINVADIDERLEREIWKTESLLRINAIRVAYYGIINILKLQTQTVLFASDHKKIQRKIKMNEGSLKVYTDIIEKYTGIKVKSFKDIENIFSRLQFFIAKFNERFSGEETDENVYLLDVALSVFSYLGQTMNPTEHTVLDFIAVRQKAIEQNKKHKNIKESA